MIQVQSLLIGAVVLLTVPICSLSLNSAPEWLLALAIPEAETNIQYPIQKTVDAESNLFPGLNYIYKGYPEQSLISFSINLALKPGDSEIPVIRVINSETGRVAYQARAKENINVIKFPYSLYSTKMHLEILKSDYLYRVDIKDTIEGVNSEKILLPSTTITIPDKDSDTIPDKYDEYPDDPMRSVSIDYPGEEQNLSVCYEDFYPFTGDSDYNDYCVEFSVEEDLAADGRIKEIRGLFQNTNRNSVYNHRLYLGIHSNVQYRIFRKVYSDDGIEVSDDEFVSRENKIDIFGFDSSVTEPGFLELNHQSNGKLSSLRIIFTEPVVRDKLGNFPYDLYLHVNQTNAQIHLPGVKATNKSDPYLDSNGNPWVVIRKQNKSRNINSSKKYTFLSQIL